MKALKKALLGYAPPTSLGRKASEAVERFYEKLRLLVALSVKKDDALGEMAEGVLCEHADVADSDVVMTQYIGSFKGSTEAEPFIKAILAFEKDRLSPEQHSALSKTLPKWKKGTGKVVKYLLARTLDGHTMVSVSVNNDDNYFFKYGNSILGEVLHRGLAYLVDPYNNVICRLDGVPKFHEVEKDRKIPMGQPVSYSSSEKKNGEFSGITIRDGWLLTQSKRTSFAVYVGDGNTLTMVNVLRALMVAYRSKKADGVPQTLQVAIITIVKLLRLKEVDRKLYFTQQNGVTKLGELCTGRHFVVNRNKPTVVVFAEWRDGRQIFVQDLPEDVLFQHPDSLPPTEDKTAVDAFCEQFRFKEGAVVLVQYPDGTFRRFKVKSHFYNEVLKGMQGKPTGLRYLLMKAFSERDVLPEEPPKLSAELQPIVQQYGVEVDDAKWYTTVWKALRVCSMLALVNPEFANLVKFLVSGNKGWGAVGFREVVEEFRELDPNDLAVIDNLLTNELSTYFKKKEEEQSLKKALHELISSLELKKSSVSGKEKGRIAKQIAVLEAFKDEDCTAEEYRTSFANVKGKKKKNAECNLLVFNTLCYEVTSTKTAIDGGGGGGGGIAN